MTDPNLRSVEGIVFDAIRAEVSLEDLVLTRETDLAQIGIDSLGLVNAVMQIEEKLSISRSSETDSAVDGWISRAGGTTATVMNVGSIIDFFEAKVSQGK